MHVIPLPVRVLLNSIEFLITLFICNIYFSECSNYSLIIMVIGNKAYSNGAIAQFPIFIAIFLLVTDIIMLGRHIFGDTHEYGVIVDYFGKGDDSVWTLLNYDFCIICLQILKYFTVYNYSVLDIYNHKPSIVKDVVKEYAQPDYNLQYISVISNDDVDQTSKDTINTHNNRKRRQRKYDTKRNFFARLFRRDKEVDDNDDENALLIVKDDEGDFDNDSSALIIKDNENEEIEEEEEKNRLSIDNNVNTNKNNNNNNINSNNNLNNNTVSSVDQAESSSSQTPASIQTTNSTSETKINQPTASSSSSNQPSSSNNNSIPSKENKIVDLIEPVDGLEDANHSTKSKDKGKSPSHSPAITSSLPSLNMGKEAVTEDQDDIFFDAYDHNSVDSSIISHSPAIPLRHVNSSSSNRPFSQGSLNDPRHSESQQGNQEESNTNEIPIYEIDERERVTEGNENALLYLESYYQFVPVINIKVHEALHVMKAIRESNRRFNERAKREERREQREQRRRDREQRRRDREQSRQSSSRSSFDFSFSNQNLVQEPESDMPSDAETENPQSQNQNQNQNQTSSTRSSVVSNQLRSYFNGLHNSFRRSLTGVPPV